MSTYAISDIHGCFDEFRQMLDIIGFSETDRLILGGDYIDRGPKNLEILHWLERRPDNVIPIRGNHDEEYVACIDLMWSLDRQNNLDTNPESNADSAALYETAKYLLRRQGKAAAFFDTYGTIGKLLHGSGVTLSDLTVWAGMLRDLPFFVRMRINSRDCVIVHAGYKENFQSSEEAADFYLYAREEGLREGGVSHGMVVAGHTPTVLPNRFTYQHGKVFRYYDAEMDCIFYGIDCGCSLFPRYPEAHLACLRLEDGEVFYTRCSGA